MLIWIKIIEIALSLLAQVLASQCQSSGPAWQNLAPTCGQAYFTLCVLSHWTCARARRDQSSNPSLKKTPKLRRERQISSKLGCIPPPSSSALPEPPRVSADNISHTNQNMHCYLTLQNNKGDLSDFSFSSGLSWSKVFPQPLSNLWRAKAANSEISAAPRLQMDR